jgi:hypothetical protein
MSIQQDRANAIVNSVTSGITLNNITNSDIQAMNLQSYSGVIFPKPLSYQDLPKITQAIDKGVAVTYENFAGKSYTIPAGIKP